MTNLETTDMLTATFSSDALPQREVPLEDDWLTYVYSDVKTLEFELGLYATKWFAYRQMTGVEATKAYIEAYGKVYKDIYAREIDYARAEHVKPYAIDRVMAGLLQDDPKTKRVWKGCWRGRQVADFLGMPYEIYLDMAFTYRMRRWQRSYMPQPQHLFHEYDVEKIQARWEELQQTSLFTCDLPAYSGQNYQGIGYQNDYHEWLLKQAMHRADPAEFLHRFISNDQLPLDKVRSRIVPSIVQRLEALLH